MYDQPENMDVMQNIEFAVINYYREHPDLTDHNVDKVYEGLQRIYHKESQGKNQPRLRFSEMEQELFEAVKKMAEWRLGRGEEPQATVITDGNPETGELRATNKAEDAGADEDETAEEAEEIETVDEDDEVEPDDVEEIDEDDDDDDFLELHDITLEEMVAVFKRLRSSINTWSGSSGYGRQGYLNYVEQYVS